MKNRLAILRISVINLKIIVKIETSESVNNYSNLIE